MEYKLYKVKWVDSTSSYGWARPEDLKDYDLSVNGIGYLIKETPEYVVFSAQIAAESFDAPIAIPRVAIVSMEEIVGGSITL